MKTNSRDFRIFFISILKAKKPFFFLLTFLLANVMIAQVFFLYRNQQSEEEFFTTIRAEYRFDNENIFGMYTYNKNQRERTQNSSFYGYKQSFLHYLDAVEELADTEGVTYFNYNLVRSFFVVNEDGEERSVRFFGISSPDFFTYHNLLTEGEIRELREDEIILPDTLKGLFMTGDTVDVMSAHNGKCLERVRVEGFYHVISELDTSYGKRDTFVNSDGAIVSNAFMKKLLEENENLLLQVFTEETESGTFYSHFNGMDLANVVYGIREYGPFTAFEDKIRDTGTEIVSYAEANDVFSCGVSYVSTDISGQLKQIVTVKQMNALFFLLLFFVYLPFLFSYARYYLDSLQKEIRQFYIFGISLRTIRIYLAGFLLIIICAALLLSLVPSAAVSGFLGRYITDSNLYYYDKFASYASNGIHPENVGTRTFYTGMDVLSWAGVFLTDILIVLSAMIFRRSGLKRGIRDHD